MPLNATKQELIQQYLLGNLPQEELLSLEERLLTDGTFYEELLIVEDELIDQYLSGELSLQQQESFRTHFMLAPERQEKVRFSRTLKKYVRDTAAVHQQEEVVSQEKPGAASDFAEHLPKKWFFRIPPFRSPIISYSLAAVGLLLLVGVSWSLWTKLRNPAPREPGQVLSVVLTPGLTREGGGTKKIAIHSDTRTVRLQLELARDDYPSYRAELLTSGGETIWVRENLTRVEEKGSKFLLIDVPLEILKHDDYQVIVIGLPTPQAPQEMVDRYRFRVLD